MKVKKSKQATNYENNEETHERYWKVFIGGISRPC